MSNQYTYSVPFTAEQLAHDYFDLRLSQQEIGVKYGTTQKVVHTAMRKLGMVSRVAAKRNQQGVANSSWRGGRVLVAKSKKQRGERTEFGNGYYYVLDPAHTNAGRGGYVAEHIKVATAARGYPLAKGECVHHVDLDKHNNSEDNLACCTRQLHAAWHNQLEELAVQFMREGLIAFDPARGYYRT